MRDPFQPDPSLLSPTDDPWKWTRRFAVGAILFFGFSEIVKVWRG